MIIPPITGPETLATVWIHAKVPIAQGNLAFGISAEKIVKLPVSTSDPAIPARTRPTMKAAEDGAAAWMIEATSKMTRLIK